MTRGRQDFAKAEQPNRDQAGNPVGITGCEAVGFKPTFEAEPTTSSAYSPTGLNTKINVPLSGLTDPTGTASRIRPRSPSVSPR